MKNHVPTKAIEAGGRLTVRSALNPVLWLCGIVTIPTIMAGAVHANIPAWVIVIGCSPVPFALFGFLFLLFFDRDKLQSEDYQIRKRTLELAQDKGDAYPVDVDRNSVIENPDLSSLENTSGDEK